VLEPSDSSLSLPAIETERLRLRPHRREDFADCLSLWTDPIVTRFIGGRPSTREEVWARLHRYRGHWSMMGYGYWVIEDMASGAYIGELGFADFMRDIDPPLPEMPELGWALLPAMHGKGYATEALRAAIAWGETHLPAPRTICIIHPENRPSIRLAEKCGFRELRRTTYKDSPTVVFGRESAAPSAAEAVHEKFQVVQKT
jgi:RimJ/RimL family protein N-acetyltransferase